ncbi:MAG TPA: sensor histidine kinase [Candidatus Limnocylindrales bacterium]|nr:sensor histidine kinase [Candidatus Limnocylindrales bacterium]
MADPRRDQIDARLPIWRYYRWVAFVFVLYPAAVVISTRPDPVEIGLAAIATVLFVWLIWVGWRLPLDDPRRRGPVAVAAVVGLAAIATSLVVLGHQTWLAFYYFASTGASPLLPVRRAGWLITLVGVVAGLTVLSAGGALVDAIVQATSVAVIGLLVLSVNETRRTNRALLAAREDLARLAVAEERNRIARDLHDTLGHTLTLVAIKSELAGRLLPADPVRAKAEIADVERVARGALATVRETVSGAHQPSLAAELAAAPSVLAAAGIRARVDGAPTDLPPAVEAVLAWTIREGITNVVRHSGASAAEVCVRSEPGRATAEIVDNGPGGEIHGPRHATSRGAGLRGLRERVGLVGGELEAGGVPGGGFRLRVVVPLPT